MDKKVLKKRSLIVLLILSPVVLTSTFAVYTYYTGPKYSLYQIQKSIEQHDITNFEKYVDMDSVAASTFDQMTLLVEENAKSDNKWENLGTSMGMGIARAMKSQLSSEIKQSLMKYVETQTISEEKPLNGLWEKIAKDKQIKIGSIKKDGMISTVNLIINNPKYNKELDFHILMRDKGSYWQVADLPDIYSTLKTISQLEDDRIAALNSPIIDEMRNSLSVYDFQKTNTSTDQWDINKQVDYEYKIKNNSRDSIKSFSGKVMISDKQNTFQKVANIKSEQALEPGQFSVWGKTEDVNQFVKESQGMYDSSTNDIDVLLILDSITFTNGKELKLYKKWDN